MKPCLQNLGPRGWRCTGPKSHWDASFGGPSYRFPWAYGATPQEAQRKWHFLARTPLPPELAASKPCIVCGSPDHRICSSGSGTLQNAPTNPTMDEHAINPGAT